MIMRYLFVIFISFLLSFPSVSQQLDCSSKHYNYLLYTPDSPIPDEGFPLIIFLHGRGETGRDLQLVKKHGLPSFLDDTLNFPFMVVSPQCPDGKAWKPRLLQRLLDEIEILYPVDTDRIYVTGLSMGGTGTWEFALSDPGRFAAIAPVCAMMKTRNACSLSSLPVWVFHGALDEVYDHSWSDNFVAALKGCDGMVTYTLYPDVDHFAWVPAYSDPELYKWFLQYSKRDE
jgi:predicted peptidase